MKTLLVCLLALAGTTAVASGSDATSMQAVTCPPSRIQPKTGPPAATITAVLHGGVFVDSGFVGSAPLNVTAESRICTDAGGRAIIRMASANGAACILLPATALRVHAATASPALDVEGGTIWCWFRARAEIGARPTQRVGATTAIVGIVPGASLQTTTVKVYSGLATIAGPLARKVAAGSQVVVSDAGAGRLDKLQLSPIDKIAITQLRLGR